MREFNLTFAEALEKLAEDPKKWFQGENFKLGTAMKSDQGMIIIEQYNQGEFTTHVSNYPLSVRTIKQKFREVFNVKELFEE